MNRFAVIEIIYLSLFISIAPLTSNAQQPKNDLRLWYFQQAANWNEALPVGNGRLGAMVFGGITHERLQLNEKTVWAGRDADFVNPGSKEALPEVRKLLFAGKYAEAQKLAQEKIMGQRTVGSSYQALGDLDILFKQQDGGITNYKRVLDLDSAIATISYESNGIRYLREVFSSAPAQALVMRLSASKKGALSFDVQLKRDGNKALLKVKGNEIVLQERVNNGNGVQLVARLKIALEGGSLLANEKSISIENATAATLVLTAATDYYGNDHQLESAQQLNRAVRQSYHALRKVHIAEYQKYFKRVTLDIGSPTVIEEPINERLTALQRGRSDPQLIQLYYQFGRYLLISSSRPGSLPANLQGLWAEGLTPPWDADYHININIQMNYWPAEITNLSEMHVPFLRFINDLRNDGRKTAKDMYGMRGAVAHFSSDAWHYTETHGQTQWAMWPMGMAWSVQHLWEHYLFTGNNTFLESDAYPAMKETAQFCLDWLIEDPATGKLVSGPSISPENTFRTKDSTVATMVMGPTMDHMIIRDLLNNTIAASSALNKDAAFRDTLLQTLQKLSPTKIGPDGRIMEWTEAFEEPEPGHRHISHLFGLYPGKEINRNTPVLLKAARRTIDYRLAHGGGHTGWSRAWIINFFARLQDGNAAYENLIALLQKSTLPNLFDNHPPFQIDGNFGAVAGITELLLQSHAGEIQILPALPKAWPCGKVKGLMARGGFEVDLEWKDGKLSAVRLLSKLGNPCQIRYGDKIIYLKTVKGRAYHLNGRLLKDNDLN